ncbi:hypothetical protein B0A55_04740 [Friedmanniomyces simplex]|uniref:Uncharacterized protein n=1 Tax=Friedmanniomyces simplex TaxID=329884 RepID=A0A4U0XNW5_9PEZI|nr:hypothetical protein B0A55_04740 [Friedmanniomyces simplex]
MDDTLIVLLIICGCGVAVFMGWAISHRFMPGDASNEVHPDAAAQQAQYMREVRLRHHDNLAAGMGGKR